VSRPRRHDGGEVRQKGKAGKRGRSWHERTAAARYDEAALPVTAEANLVDPASGEPARLTESEMHRNRGAVV
jgi:hypothetical protein